LCLLAATASADNSSFRPYVVGSRASGMGGAFTALADDGAGPYYNPGGIAFAKHASLSLFVSAYGLVTGTFSNALGDGHDFSFRTLDTFPVSTAIVLKPTADDAVALSAFVPDAIRIDDRDTLGRVDNTFFFTLDEKTVWAGASYARRFGRLGVGGGTFLLIGDATTSFDLTTTQAASYATVTGRTDETSLGVVATAGARYDLCDHWHLGLAIYSPELGAGRRRLFTRVATDTQIMVINADDLHASPTQPLRVQSGAAWSDGVWTIAADAIVLGPRSVTDDASRAGEGLERRVVRHAVVDGSLGAERVLAGKFPIRAGAFTDFAASPEPVAQPGSVGIDLPSAQHVDRYGATASAGYRTDHTATNFGLVVSYGTGHGLTPDNLSFATLLPQPTHQLSVYVLASSSYEF
jgi:long-chain fatty acid transport protein